MPSRVAKNPIKVPAGVQAQLSGDQVVIKGKLGELSHTINTMVKVSQVNDLLQVEAIDQEIKSNALAGTTRALMQNMVHGVTTGFERKLVMVGVGYRAKAQGNVLNLSVGFSHPVDMKMPKGITVETPSVTEIVIKGADRQVVNQIAANIRAVRPPEPYKGKGIRYSDEHVVRKEAKKK